MDEFASIPPTIGHSYSEKNIVHLRSLAAQTRENNFTIHTLSVKLVFLCLAPVVYSVGITSVGHSEI